MKPIDEKNDAPEFQDADGIAVSSYTAERREDTTHTPIEGANPNPNTIRITEALPAADPADGEDDDSRHNVSRPPCCQWTS